MSTRYWLAISGLVGMTYAQVAPTAASGTDAISLWERGGIVALLLAGIVVLWRNGQQEAKYNRELLVQILGAVQKIENVGQKMETAGEKMEGAALSMDQISVRLENLQCPLLEHSEDQQRQPGRPCTKKSGR